MKSAQEIGKYFTTKLNLPNSREGNIKVQKLLFFAWLIHFYKFKESLFEDEFFAYEYGPVVENIRKSYHADYFLKTDEMLPKYSENESETLMLTNEIFGDSDFDELIEISHKSPIWEKYFKNSMEYDSKEDMYSQKTTRIPKEELQEELRMIENVLYAYEYQNQKTADA